MLMRAATVVQVLYDFEVPPTIAPRPPTTVANPHIDRSLGSKETHIQSRNPSRAVFVSRSLRRSSGKLSMTRKRHANLWRLNVVDRCQCVCVTKLSQVRAVRLFSWTIVVAVRLLDLLETAVGYMISTCWRYGQTGHRSDRHDKTVNMTVSFHFICYYYFLIRYYYYYFYALRCKKQGAKS